MEQLQATFDKLLRETSTTFHRYMYNRINWDARMIGLMGPRGVGKTTLVLQHIKEQLPRKDSMYRQKIFILPVTDSPNWQIHLQRWEESIFSLMKSINTRIGQGS